MKKYRNKIVNSISIYAFYFPLMALAIFQFISIPFELYIPSASATAKILVFFCYFSFILSICASVFSYRNKYNDFHESLEIISLRPLVLKTIVLLLIFIYVKLSVEVIKHGLVVGFEYIRYEYFFNQDFRSKLFGGMFFDWIFNIFILPSSWLIISFLTFSKRGSFFYWSLLLAIIIYSVSIGGRFSIYYAMLFVYFRFCYFNRSGYSIMIKSILLTIAVALFSAFIVSSRVSDFDFSSSILSIIEYHTSPPFFLMDKIDDELGNVWFSGIPLYSIFTSLVLSLMKLLGVYGDHVPYYYFTTYLNDFTITSTNTGFRYNAFSTIFIFFVVEFGFLAPIFIFSYFYVLFSIPMLVSKELRLPVTAFIIVFTFFSLFRYEVATPSFQVVMLIFICVSLFNRIKKRVL